MTKLAKLRVTTPWIREFLSEFMGTFILILIGESSMAHLVLKKQGDVFAAVFCWGVAVMMGILTCLSNSGGHINPAVSTALACIGKFPWTKVPHYVLAQYLGSFTACALLYGNQMYLMNAYDGGVRSTIGANATGILWTTFPDPNVPISICALDTIICSATLLFGILVILDKSNTGFPPHLIALHVGLLVIAVCWGMGSNCMAGINPARDFAPRVFASLIGYNDVFSHRNFWWVPLFMPHVGAVIGCVLYEVTIGVHTPVPERKREEHKPML